MASMDAKRLGDLTAICYRYPTFYGFEYQESGIPVLKGENITRDGELIEVNEPSFISQEIHDTYPKTQLALNDLVMSVRGEVGKVGLVDQRFAGGNINANTIRISLKKEVAQNQALPGFVWAVFNSTIGASQIRRLISGGVQETITAPEILDILIPLPMLSIQQEMVGKMERARESRRRKLEQAVALLAGLDGFVLDRLGLTLSPRHDSSQAFAVRRSAISARADAHYNQPHFRRLAAMILGRHGSHLRELSSVIFSGTTPLSGGTAYTSKELGVPFVRSGEITSDGRVVKQPELCLRREIHDGPMKRSQLRQGDVLIAIVGATIGSVGVYDREDEANINQAIAGVRLIPNLVHPDYIVAFLKSSAGQAVLEMVSRPVARANINLEEIGELFIPVPGWDIQEQIAAEVAHRRDEARRLREEAAREWEAAKAHFESRLLGKEAAL
jgi:type I restriction enzyme S subunit